MKGHYLYFLRLFVCSLLMVALLAQAQEETSTVSATKSLRDPNAVAIITRALEASGGAALWTTLADTHAAASCTTHTKMGDKTHTVRWITAGDAFRFDGGDSDKRGLVHGAAGDAQVVSGKVIPISDRTVRGVKRFHLPSLMLRSDLSAADTLIDINPKKDKDDQETVVRVIDIVASKNNGEPQIELWKFDPKSGLPSQVEYSQPAPNSLLIYLNTTVAFSEYSNIRGLIVPGVITRTFEGGPTTTCRLSDLETNQAPDVTLFAPIAEGMAR